MQRMRLRIWTWLAAPALAAGCASPPPRSENPVVTAAPVLTELPAFPGLEQTLSATVRIEGQPSLAARTVIVPDLKEPPLTDAEKKALGIRDEGKDLLAFYQPRVGPEHGRSDTDRGGVSTEIHGSGQLAARMQTSVHKTGVDPHSLGGPGVISDILARRVGHVSPFVSSIYGYGPSVYIVTGVDQERIVAGKHTRVGQ